MVRDLVTRERFEEFQRTVQRKIHYNITYDIIITILRQYYLRRLTIGIQKPPMSRSFCEHHVSGLD